MTKLRTPLLSLEAHGSIGDSVTFQSSTKRKFAREKPFPFDQRSDAQLAHRAKYLAVCKMWGGLTAAQKQAWLTAARPFHITGFNLFMRTFLPTLDGLILYYPLNYGVGSVAYNYSLYPNNGTIFGASWADGIFDKCLYFDGTNDYIAGGDHTSLDIREEITLMAWIKLDGLGRIHSIIDRDDGVNRNWFFHISVLNQLQGGVRIAAAWAIAQGVYTFTTGVWHLVTFTYDGSFVRGFVDGFLDGPPVAAAGLIDNNDVSLSIGAREGGLDRFAKAWIDEPMILAEAMSPIYIPWHYERGTP